MSEDCPSPPASKGWYVPRSLPHFDSPGVVQAITFRLDDALPRTVALSTEGETAARYRLRIAEILDGGFGDCVLKDARAAEAVESVLLRRAQQDYDLHAWVVMPNHVHVLISPFPGRAVSDIVQAWKSVSARVIEKVTRRGGRVWQREYFDRYMRHERHAAATVDYIEQNPVKAGLVRRPEDWRFGSAWWREQLTRVGGEGAAPPGWAQPA